MRSDYNKIYTKSKLILRAIFLMSIMIPVTSVVALSSIETSSNFHWDYFIAYPGDTVGGTGTIQVYPLGIPFSLPKIGNLGVQLPVGTGINFAVVTNYSVNGIKMPPFKIIGEMGGLQPVPVTVARWGSTTVYAAAYYSRLWFLPVPATIGYYITQDIPINPALGGGKFYGVAGAINLNITPWWAWAIQQDYSYEILTIENPYAYVMYVGATYV